MLVIAQVLAGLAALLHVYIWWLESLVFETRGRKVFGLSADDVPAARQWAFNQGFYNLFLALITIAGVAVCRSGHGGIALMYAGTGSMLGAAVVLVADDHTKVRAAVLQGTLPLLAILALVAHRL